MTAQKTIYGQRQISSSSQFYNPLNPAPGCPGRPSGQVVTVSTINCNYHHHHPWYCQVCHHRFSSLSVASVREVVCTQNILLISGSQQPAKAAPCVCSALIIVLFPDVYLWRANTCHHLPQSPRPLSKFHCSGPRELRSLNGRTLHNNFYKLNDGLEHFN